MTEIANQFSETEELKLFMVLIGSKAPGRNVEQHDFFFGVGTCLKNLVADIKIFWPEAGSNIHIDAWREVTMVDGYHVTIVSKTEYKNTGGFNKKLFFINLGGYQENKFEEQHYTILTVKTDRASALKEAKTTRFFKHNHIKGASAHIDNAYGIDVDDLHQIEDILSPIQKQKYCIQLIPSASLECDVIHLGYLKLSAVK